MKHQISTSIRINASTETVWNEFINFEAYPQWNPFIKSLKGKTAVNEQIEVQITTMTFKPKVKVYDEKREFTWLGTLFFKGLFDGRHSFKFEQNQDGSTTFIHEEKFRGILVSLMKKKLNTEIKDGFIAMNEALKARIEG